tara:strand:+ start:99 stop:566 length:468 start_codon:yes stop_codon:yes gene_type:complete
MKEVSINRKGQGATEYLIILGVIIIIALIVVGVLGGIPGIGKSSNQQAAEAYWATADVAVQDWYLSAASDNLKYTLKNNQDNSITILDVTVDGTANTTDISVSPGGTSDSGVDKTCATQGDAYEYGTVVINYQDQLTLANYTFTGTLGLSGECTQ